ncbi:MAG: hypothetical protein Q9204_003982 [Flavoplaca sp. TL-2023a]
MAILQLRSSSGYLLLLYSLTLCLFNVLIDATPIAPPPFTPVTRGFPSLQECHDKIKPVEKNKSMYFTGLNKKNLNKAKRYAKNHGLTHVSDPYPTGFTDRGRYSGTEGELNQFQKDFSQTYAEKTEGTAYLMLDENRNPAPTGIFYSVEFEAMKKGGHVDKILQFPYNNGDGIDDPSTATKVFCEKAKDVASYAKGQCGVHITHYHIRRAMTSITLRPKTRMHMDSRSATWTRPTPLSRLTSLLLCL